MLTRLIKRIKQVFFRGQNFDLNLTRLIKRVTHVNPFS